jgi:hypothetical protein
MLLENLECIGVISLPKSGLFLANVLMSRKSSFDNVDGLLGSACLRIPFGIAVSKGVGRP